MSKTWILIAQSDGRMIGKDYVGASLRDYCKENPGKKLRVEPVKTAVSDEMRGYYFGAVLPVVRQTCIAWEKLSPDELHEVLKKMFNYFETTNPVTNRTERFGRPTMSRGFWSDSVKAMEFLDKVGEYLGSCGLSMPDPEEYKKLRDTGKLPDSHYNKKKKS